MPGPFIPDPTPAWLKPENASVTDSAMTKALRMIGHLIGADNPTSQVLALMAPLAPEGTEAGGLVGQVSKFIKAYHGSPHDFERFDIGKIGTGEGAQAYGHGLYFAENPEVARIYKEQLSQGNLLTVRTPKGEVFQGNNLDDVGLEATKYLEYGAKDAGQFKHNTGYYALKRAENAPDPVKARIREWADAKISYEPIRGKMYEVAIKADPESFLDWDKPLSQQSEQVQKAIMQKAGFKPSRWKETPVEKLNLGEWAEQQFGPQFKSDVFEGKQKIATFQGKSPEDVAGKIAQWRSTQREEFLNQTGRQAYENLGAVGRPGSSYVTTGADPIGASFKLKQAGIPGLKYLDQGSRAAGEGSRNYVVFDDTLVDILKKYGIAVPVIEGLRQTAQQQQGVLHQDQLQGLTP